MLISIVILEFESTVRTIELYDVIILMTMKTSNCQICYVGERLWCWFQLWYWNSNRLWKKIKFDDVIIFNTIKTWNDIISETKYKVWSWNWLSRVIFDPDVDCCAEIRINPQNKSNLMTLSFEGNENIKLAISW